MKQQTHPTVTLAFATLIGLGFSLFCWLLLWTSLALLF